MNAMVRETFLTQESFIVNFLDKVGGDAIIPLPETADF